MRVAHTDEKYYSVDVTAERINGSARFRDERGQSMADARRGARTAWVRAERLRLAYWAEIQAVRAFERRP